jgi:hypothetical protein
MFNMRLRNIFFILLPLVVAQVSEDRLTGKGFTAPKRTTPAACAKGNGMGAAKGPVGANLESSAPKAGPKDDYPTMMCKNHPLDGSSPSGKATEDCWGSPNGKGPDEVCIKDDSGGSGKTNSEPNKISW